MISSDLQSIASALTNAQLRFLIVGGIAVIAHGYGRVTQDLDVVIGLNKVDVNAFFDVLRSIGYRPIVPVTAEQFAQAEVRKDWAENKHMTVLSFSSDQHPGTAIDVFINCPFDFEEEYQKALIIDGYSPPIRVVRLETLIKMKRQSGRPQDLADITELMSINSFDEK